MTITYDLSGPESGQPTSFTIKEPQEGYSSTGVLATMQLDNATITNAGFLRQINRQLSAGTAVFFLFVYGGMDLAHSSGWNQTLNNTASQQFECSWFIGVIAGAAFSSLFMTFVPKLPFYILGALMQLTGSIMFACAPFNYGLLIAARYVAGFGIGLITVPFIIHSAEVATNNYRGISGAMEQSGLALGIAIQVIYDAQLVEDKNASVNQIHGILGIVFSLLGLILAVLSIESPIFYLRRKHEEKARRCQEKLLVNSFTSTVDGALEEASLYVAESGNRTLYKEFSSSLVPFVKLLLYRGLVAFTFSLPLTRSVITSTVLTEGNVSSWPVTVWGLLRVVGALIAQGCLDRLGRKILSLVGLLCMASLMLGMAVSYENPTNVRSYYYMSQVRNLGVAFQAFTGLFICSTTVYLGEGFSVRVKPFFVGYVVAFEETIHIINIVGFNGASEDFFYRYYLSVGIILLVCVVFFAIVMPETKKTTLRESVKRFRRLHNLKLY